MRCKLQVQWKACLPFISTIICSMYVVYSIWSSFLWSIWIDLIKTNHQCWIVTLSPVTWCTQQWTVGSRKFYCSKMLNFITQKLTLFCKKLQISSNIVTYFMTLTCSWTCISSCILTHILPMNAMIWLQCYFYSFFHSSMPVKSMLCTPFHCIS